MRGPNVVDPDLLVAPSIPSITVLELVDGRYTEVAARGDQTIEVDCPFRVALNPAELAAQEMGMALTVLGRAEAGRAGGVGGVLN